MFGKGMMSLENNKSIEILAPCGSYDSVVAAVRQGADAVYIGALMFSARAYAKNFGQEELKKAVDYCHLHGVKAHMAINTLVSDEELFTALKTAQDAYKMGVDAFIVQDLGLAQLMRESMPQIVLHASTQMGVHTPEAAKFLNNSGFERVVLAREMSLDEIKEIVKSCPAETEVFVHGALCMCMSGQCYLSAVLGGRSGNRGRCAQPCRLPFAVKNGTGHDLSLKDNCLVSELPRLIDLGVTSAKIEGRMKRPEYVAAAVAACRHTCESGVPEQREIERLRAIFSRSGFTDGYFYGKLGKEMFGTRSKDDVISATDKVLSEIRAEYKDEAQTNSVNMRLTVVEGSPASLAAECKGHTVCVRGEMPQTAIKAALSAEKAVSQLSKTGGTSFKADSVTVEIGDGLTLPVSSINSMRREILAKLEEKLTAVSDKSIIDIEIPSKPLHIRKSSAYRASFRNCDIPDCFKQCEIVYVPLFSKTEDLQGLISRGFKVAVEVPRAIFGLEKKVESALLAAKQLGVADVYCGNIGTAALAVRLGFEVHGGFGLNVFNSCSVDYYNRMGLADTELSFELTAGQINNIKSDKKIGMVCYGYLPLMITRNCPNKNGSGCKTCGGQSRITDRKGNSFALMCSSGCTELLNCTPLYLADKQNVFRSVDFMTFRFTFESPSECEDIFYSYIKRQKPTGEFTRGLYFRGVE